MLLEFKHQIMKAIEAAERQAAENVFNFDVTDERLRTEIGRVRGLRLAREIIIETFRNFA